MSRTQLLGAVSAVALSCLATGAFAQESTTNIQGGGSTLAEFDYFSEFQTFNNNAASGDATFNNPAPATGNNVLYWPSGSGAGQLALLNNDLSCDANKVTGNNNKNCSGTVGGAAAVDYGASDATFSTSQIAQWNSSSVGAAVAGHLIQLPSMGVGVSFPVVNAKVTANGATTTNRAMAGGVVFTDDDLCGIFSGKLTNWNQTSAASKLAAGTINVVYRSDGSGTSFLLLNHFAAVCTASNSSFTLPIVPSTTFTSVFTTVPSNFTGESGSSGVASYMDNATGVSGAPTVSSAIGYLSPDFTTVDPNSSALLADGSKSTLVVAAVKLGNLVYIPTVTNITNALNHPAMGTNLTPPKTAATAADPTAYVPLVQTVTVGYPVVGYTTFGFAQCYASNNVANGIISFMKDHYSTQAAYASTIANNGFVSVSTSGAKAFANVISKAILSNADKFNDNIQNTTVCAGKPGR